MPDFSTDVPHIARVYDDWLGGKDNFAADREAAERAMAATPNLVDPGVVPIQQWRPEPVLDFDSAPTAMWGCLARKP